MALDWKLKIYCYLKLNFAGKIKGFLFCLCLLWFPLFMFNFLFPSNEQIVEFIMAMKIECIFLKQPKLLYFFYFHLIFLALRFRGIFSEECKMNREEVIIHSPRNFLWLSLKRINRIKPSFSAFEIRRRISSLSTSLKFILCTI